MNANDLKKMAKKMYANCVFESEDEELCIDQIVEETIREICKGFAEDASFVKNKAEDIGNKKLKSTRDVIKLVRERSSNLLTQIGDK